MFGTSRKQPHLEREFGHLSGWFYNFPVFFFCETQKTMRFQRFQKYYFWNVMVLQGKANRVRKLNGMQQRRGFNKHRRPTKRVGYFAHRGRLLFLK